MVEDFNLDILRRLNKLQEDIDKWFKIMIETFQKYGSNFTKLNRNLEIEKCIKQYFKSDRRYKYQSGSNRRICEIRDILFGIIFET